MKDNRPVRCWIHPSLKEELAQWQIKINEIAILETSYPIQRLENLPLTSDICATILKKIRMSLKKGDLKVFKDKKNKNIRIEIIFGEQEGDNNNLNIELQKIKGIKKNEIMFW